MKEFAQKNFAKGAARKVMEALNEIGADESVVEYGAVPLDPEAPEGRYIMEFNINAPLASLAPEAQAALAEARVIEEDPTERQPQTQAQGTPEPQGAPVAQPGTQQPPQASTQAQESPTATTREVTGFDGQKVTAEIPVAAGRKGLAVRNGATQPAVGTMARMVWDEADRISAEKKRPALGEELRASLLPKGLAGSSISSQYKAWRQFWNVTDEAIKQIEDAMAGPEREALNARKAEEKRLKDEIRETEKKAKAVEIALRKETKKAERAAIKAAKSQGKDAEKAAREAAKSEEAKKRLEERLAKNVAVAAERQRAAEAKAEERRKQQEARQAARIEEFKKRQAEAQAKLDAARNGTTPAPVAPETNAGGETPSTDSGDAQAASGAGTDPGQSESANAPTA